MRFTLIALLIAGVSAVDGWGQVTWKIDTLDDEGNDVNCIAYGGGKFVVADIYRMHVSSNGSDWAEATPTANNYAGCQSITYAAGEFFALGYLLNSTTTQSLNVFTSTDGATWSAKRILQWEVGVIGYGGGTYIALGTYDTIGIGYKNNYDLIKSSTDGITWVTRDSGRTSYLDGIAYGSNLFVAVGQHGSILTSPDGTAWTIRTLPGSDTTSLESIAYGNGTFVIVGNNPHKTYYSTNGIDWTISTPPASVAYLTNITYGAGQFVLCGEDSQHTLFLTSSDGIAWTLRTTGFSHGGPSCIAYGNGYFVAGCISTGPFSIVMSSPAISSVSHFPSSNELESAKMQLAGSTMYYNLPSASHAMLSICNLSGKRVAMLCNSWQSSGRHGVALPAGIASGSYIVSLRAGDHSVDRKIMIGK